MDANTTLCGTVITTKLTVVVEVDNFRKLSTIEVYNYVYMCIINKKYL